MSTRQEHIRQLAGLDMVEMKPTGSWGLTRAGEDFLDQLDLMRELDDRPGAARASQPGRTARRARQAGANTPKAQRPRDERSDGARGARKSSG